MSDNTTQDPTTRQFWEAYSTPALVEFLKAGLTPLVKHTEEEKYEAYAICLELEYRITHNAAIRVSH